MKYLNHPHIVKVFDVLETEEDVVVIMEYVSGGELFDYIVAHGRLKPDQARKFFRQILSAIDYCHKVCFFFPFLSLNISFLFLLIHIDFLFFFSHHSKLVIVEFNYT